jgi:hypothetical protein
VYFYGRSVGQEGNIGKYTGGEKAEVRYGDGRNLRNLL